MVSKMYQNTFGVIVYIYFILIQSNQGQVAYDDQVLVGSPLVEDCRFQGDLPVLPYLGKELYSRSGGVEACGSQGAQSDTLMAKQLNQKIAVLLLENSACTTVLTRLVFALSGTTVNEDDNGVLDIQRTLKRELAALSVPINGSIPLCDCALTDTLGSPPPPPPVVPDSQSNLASTYIGPIHCGETVYGDTGHNIIFMDSRQPSPAASVSFHITERTPVLFETCGTSWDTYITIYHASNMSEVAHDDDGCDQSRASRLYTHLNPGDYYLLIEGFHSWSKGPFILNMDPRFCPMTMTSYVDLVECYLGETGLPILGSTCDDETFRQLPYLFGSRDTVECSRAGGIRDAQHIYRVSPDENDGPQRFLVRTCSGNEVNVQVLANPVLYENASEIVYGRMSSLNSWSTIRKVTDEFSDIECPSGSFTNTFLTSWMPGEEFLVLIEPKYNTVGSDSYRNLKTGYEIQVARALTTNSTLLVNAGIDGGLLLRADQNAVQYTVDRSSMGGLGAEFELFNGLQLDYKTASWGSIAYDPYSELFYSPPRNASSTEVGGVLVIDVDRRSVDISSYQIDDADPGDGWSSIAYDPVSGKLFAPPATGDSVLVIDPSLNATDVTSITGIDIQGVQCGCSDELWSGIAYVPLLRKFYAAPHCSKAVLIIDPASLVADTATIQTQHCTRNQWTDFEYVNDYGKLYAAPAGADGILVVDPISNLSSSIPIDSTNCHDDGCWSGIAYAANTGKLYGSPMDAQYAFIVDLETNLTDVTTLGPFIDDSKWRGIIYLAETGLLYCAPMDKSYVLIIDPVLNATDRSAISDLTNVQWKYSAFVFDPQRSILVAAPYSQLHDTVLVVEVSPNPCLSNSRCARLCASGTCGWNDNYDICVADTLTSRIALLQNYGAGDSCPAFQVSSNCKIWDQRIREMAESSQIRYVDGFSATIPGISGACLDRSVLFENPSMRSYDDITFDVIIKNVNGDPIDSNMFACVNPSTASITFGNLIQGDYDVAFDAVDAGGIRIHVSKFRIYVRNHLFKLNDQCAYIQQSIFNQVENHKYYIEEFQTIDGFDSSCNKLRAFDGAANPEEISFRLDMDYVEENGRGNLSFWGDKLVDSATGDMLIRPQERSVDNQFRASLVAVDGDKREFTVANWSLVPQRRPDTFFAEYGPNGKSCGNGQTFDMVKFDKSYTCNCFRGWSGENCDQVASSSSSTTATVIGSVMGLFALALSVLLALLVFKSFQRQQKVSRIKTLAFSNNANQQELNAALFEALQMQLYDLALRLLDRGASAAAREKTTSHLPHAIVLGHSKVHRNLLLQLLQSYCMIDSQMGNLIDNEEQNEKLTLLTDLLCLMAKNGWTDNKGRTTLHQVAKSCEHKSISVETAVIISEALLKVAPDLLVVKDMMGKTVGDIAMRCEDAVELELLVTVVVHEFYQLVHPNEKLYQSETALVMECRDLSIMDPSASMTMNDSDKAGSILRGMSINKDGLLTGPRVDVDTRVPLVIKLMSDRNSWHREAETRRALPTGVHAAIVPLVAATSSKEHAYKQRRSIHTKRRKGKSTTKAKKSKDHILAVEYMRDYPYALVMERAERNLAEIISNERLAAEPLDSIRFTAQKIARCVDQLHRAGVVHGDIKPRNVVRANNNKFKLIDFDMSFAPNQDNEQLATLPSQHASREKIMGTSAYTCPELIKWTADKNRARRKRTRAHSPTATMKDATKLDIWSYGCTLYEMVTGSPLFVHSYDTATDESLERLMNWDGIRDSEESVIANRHDHQDLTALLDLLRWTLSKNPDERPTSMSVVLEHAFFNRSKGSMREHFVVDRIKSLLVADSGGWRPCCKIMISYCWANSTFVLDRLALALAPFVEGMWLDRLGGSMGMGEWTRESMKAGVAGADVVIAIVSPEYVKSKNCGFEMDLAAELKKTVVPVKLGVPFSEWPPQVIGTTTMKNQFADPETGDMKLFVDMEDQSNFETRFVQELKPRLTKVVKPHDFSEICTAMKKHDDLSGITKAIPYELERSSIALEQELGRGEFGTVYKAVQTIGDDRSTVAVKQLRIQEDSSPGVTDGFLQEAVVTASFKHKNVIKLVGVVTAGTPYLMVIEFCELGSLDKLLKETHLEVDILLKFASDIASGMNHLASMHFVHRDLAARNVLVGGDNCCKVADFGLTRSLYDKQYYKQKSKATRLPLRWLAPELQVALKFSEASDVWAYGVTLIEMFTGAATPYGDWSNDMVIERVASGFRLKKPDICPQYLYDDVILKCFEADPHERPLFSAIFKIVDSLQNMGDPNIAPPSNTYVETNLRPPPLRLSVVANESGFRSATHAKIYSSPTSKRMMVLPQVSDIDAPIERGQSESYEDSEGYLDVVESKGDVETTIESVKESAGRDDGVVNAYISDEIEFPSTFAQPNSNPTSPITPVITFNDIKMKQGDIELLPIGIKSMPEAGDDVHFPGFDESEFNFQF